MGTLASMVAARHLIYTMLGFRLVPPYCDNPMPGTLYMALELD